MRVSRKRLHFKWILQEQEPEQIKVAGSYGLRGRGGWGYGTRRESVHGGLAKTSMFWTVPTPHPPRPRPRMVGAHALERYGVPTNGRHLPMIDHLVGHDRWSWRPSRPASTHRRGRGSACPAATVKNMDVFDKPPWVKAHGLRGTASRATERTAAGGWAGARRAVHGVSRRGMPALAPADRNQQPGCSRTKQATNKKGHLAVAFKNHFSLISRSRSSRNPCAVIGSG